VIPVTQRDEVSSTLDQLLRTLLGHLAFYGSTELQDSAPEERLKSLLSHGSLQLVLYCFRPSIGELERALRDVR